MESASVLTKQQRIAENARIHPDVAFTSVAYHMDLEWLHEAYRRTRKDGAVGVDEQTAEQYAANLEQNLESLLERAKAGTYQAPPVRRVHIPKGTSGEIRPIGIPTFEDKILQRAVCWSRCVSRISWAVHTAFAPSDRRTRRWRHSGNR